MSRAAEIDATTRLGQPQLNTVPLERPCDLEELLTGSEGTLVLTDHDRVEASRLSTR